VLAFSFELDAMKRGRSSASCSSQAGRGRFDSYGSHPFYVLDFKSVIGGKNNQGKTSVLDAIAWALGGDKYRPSQAQRDGSVLPPSLHIVMNNGLVVERKGKNGDLKVTDPTNRKEASSC